MANRVGLWLIGARGGVASIVALGLSALQRNHSGTTGLVSELDQFQSLDLINWGEIVLGGHEIRSGSVLDEVKNFQATSRAFDSSVVDGSRDELLEFDQRIMPGILHHSGTAIEDLADPEMVQSAKTPREKIELVKNDINEFATQNSLSRVVVINVASTEAATASAPINQSWQQICKLLDQPSGCHLPCSSLYAIAAMELGHAYVNFTPSLGSDCPPLCELAELQQVAHAGQDGKTGETLIKSALAPVFAMRNLNVMSWVGHNIFGNMDGKVLDDPLNKQTKVASKDQVLGDILGYHPQSHISIEYIESLGDWKTAWDHIHFQGFLGTPMVMQFTWQGCDSMLASPLVLDLFRFVERAQRANQSGVLQFLSCFFKSPIQVAESNFVRQFSMLEQWATKMGAADHSQQR